MVNPAATVKQHYQLLKSGHGTCWCGHSRPPPGPNLPTSAPVAVPFYPLLAPFSPFPLPSNWLCAGLTCSGSLCCSAGLNGNIPAFLLVLGFAICKVLYVTIRSSGMHVQALVGLNGLNLKLLNAGKKEMKN